ncbi:hypothetical protein ANN_11188 [Periplaneta americana]|uniref:Uncharacterized protein n=1 Tax=Periplaneta americana TaxID=6978 RepID=A0ABQ8T5V2_PERAM|nr:hypothetical protein ANN_11188 [Periplaneta americana]
MNNRDDAIRVQETYKWCSGLYDSTGHGRVIPTRDVVTVFQTMLLGLVCTISCYALSEFPPFSTLSIIIRSTITSTTVTTDNNNSIKCDAVYENAKERVVCRKQREVTAFTFPKKNCNHGMMNLSKEHIRDVAGRSCEASCCVRNNNRIILKSIDRHVSVSRYHNLNTRSQYDNTLEMPLHTSSLYSSSFTVATSRHWNSLPPEVKGCRTLISFK